MTAVADVWPIGDVVVADTVESNPWGAEEQAIGRVDVEAMGSDPELSVNV